MGRIGEKARHKRRFAKAYRTRGSFLSSCPQAEEEGNERFYACVPCDTGMSPPCHALPRCLSGRVNLPRLQPICCSPTVCSPTKTVLFQNAMPSHVPYSTDTGETLHNTRNIPPTQTGQLLCSRDRERRKKGRQRYPNQEERQREGRRGNKQQAQRQ